MGQIKNIKLHIVTDIKEIIFDYHVLLRTDCQGTHSRLSEV